MSLPDHLLDDEEGECVNCGVLITARYRLCGECRQDLENLYGDMQVQNAKEGNHR